MKLMLAAAAALTTLAGFGTTAVNADDNPTLPPFPGALIDCIQSDSPTGIPRDCFYCVAVDGLPPAVVVQFGADATTVPVPDLWKTRQVCTDSPVGNP